MEFVALVDGLGGVGMMMVAVTFVVAVGLLLFDRPKRARTHSDRATYRERHAETRSAA